MKGKRNQRNQRKTVVRSSSMEEITEGHLPKLAETLPEYHQGEQGERLEERFIDAVPESPYAEQTDETDKWADEGGNIRTPIHLKTSEVDVIRREDEKLEQPRLSTMGERALTPTPTADVIDVVAARLSSASAQTSNLAAAMIEGARETAHTMVDRTMESKTFILEKAVSTRDLLMDKAQSSREFAVETAAYSKDVLVDTAFRNKENIAEKLVEGKGIAMKRAEQSRRFMAGSLFVSRKFFAEKTEAGRLMFYRQGTYFVQRLNQSGLWVYRKSIDSGKYLVEKADLARQWVLRELLAPFLINTLMLTHDAAEASKAGMEYVATRTEEMEKTVEERILLPLETPTPTDVEPNLTKYYTTLNTSSPLVSDKAAEAHGYEALKGTQEEMRGLIHQE